MQVPAENPSFPSTCTSSQLFTSLILHETLFIMADTATATLSDQDIESLLTQAETRLSAKQRQPRDQSLVTPSKPAAAKTSKTVASVPKDAPAAVSTTSSGQKGNDLSVRVPELRRSKKEMTTKSDTGPAWFNLPKTEMTPDLRRDLQLLRLRDVLDPKRHYKKDASKPAVPEYSQVGTIVAGPTDYFNARMTKKERKRTLLEEVLETEDTTRRFKSKYGEIQAAKGSGKKGHYKKMMQKRYGRNYKG
ncbi:Fcf2 pre-rRNA processing-domain-containing protein [Xylariaceae sp. FL0804]|nr:Fcf2 pre-rRNA processing-domain-containing protein [Xylariaceae sp. FL0804]